MPLRLPVRQALGVTLLLFSLAPAAEAARNRTISIAHARTLPLGTVVTVEGSVSTPSGAFESSFFDKGFAIQDATGGIFVSLQTDLHVAPRARAKVTGVLREASGLLVVAPANTTSAVRIERGGPPVQPLWVQTYIVGEVTEGLIVRVVGTITEEPTNDLPFGYKFTVDDGTEPIQIFVNTQTGIDVSTLDHGDLVEVIGFSSQFETHYEIDPRSPSDIRVPWNPNS